MVLKVGFDLGVEPVDAGGRVGVFPDGGGRCRVVAGDGVHPKPWPRLGRGAPGKNDEFYEFGEFLWLAPLGEAFPLVGAHEPVESRVGVPFLHGFGRSP